PQGQAEAVSRQALPAERRQEGHRDSRGRPLDRRHDGPVKEQTMALKTYRPTSEGMRHLVLVDRRHLWKSPPVKSLTERLTKTGGRNNSGRMTTRHIGGGHKRTYRRIDFRRRRFDQSATVERLEYDPNRSAFIALVKY